MMYLDHPLGTLLDIAVLVAILSAAAWVRDRWNARKAARSRSPAA